MINIETCEQYDSVLSLLDLLSKLQITNNVEVAKEFIDTFEYDFQRKECCGAPRPDCFCDTYRDYPDYDSSDMYCDEVSFEKDEPEKEK
jgi:hypothetical protein